MSILCFSQSGNLSFGVAVPGKKLSLVSRQAAGKSNQIIAGRSCCRESSLRTGLAYRLLVIENKGIIISMGKRLLTYMAMFFVSVSSLMFACPDVYSLSENYRTLSDVSMPEAKPCHDGDHQPAHSVCYRALHDRFFAPATISGPLGGQRALLVAFAESVLSGSIVSPRHPVWRSKSPPKLALTVLFSILRI